MAGAGGEAAERGRLRWRCRRGLRELDELLTGYFDSHYDLAPAQERAAFAALLDRRDEDLHAWLLGQGQPEERPLRELVARITARSSGGP